jgi:hypothetical protein
MASGSPGLRLDQRVRNVPHGGAPGGRAREHERVGSSQGAEPGV